MRDRAFIQASESPRPYSEIRAERDDFDVQEQVLKQITGLEADAADALEADNTADAKRLQCEAEDLRCALRESKRATKSLAIDTGGRPLATVQR